MHPEGEVHYQGTLHLIPAFYIDTIGPDFSIPVADIPIPFSVDQKDWVFDPVRVHVPLPDISLEGDESSGLDGAPNTAPAPLTIDLGTVTVGEQSSKQISLKNVGEATLAAGFSLDDGQHFTLQTPSITLDQDHEADQLVVFTATEPGEFVTTLSITTNDPDEPLRTVEIRAAATELGGTDVEVDTPVKDDGCGCRMGGRGPDAPSYAALLGAVVIGATAARRRRRA